MPAGAAVGGLLAEAFGLRAVFATMGLLVLGLLLPDLTITDAGLDRAETEADHPPPAPRAPALGER